MANTDNLCTILSYQLLATKNTYNQIGAATSAAQPKIEPGQDFRPMTRPDPIRCLNDVKAKTVMTSQAYTRTIST